jgi:carbon-monoxide dehydrogenase medium subunit
MKPAPFRYARPATAAEAVALLASARGDAKLLAGGQSLVPLLNMRLVRPTVLVDLNGARELERIDGAPDEVPLRRGRPAPHVDVHGLPQAHRDGRAHHRGRPARASVAGHPARAKGVGEGGSIPGPAAVANAVEDALAHPGVVVRSLPITPEQVWRWLRAGSG